MTKHQCEYRGSFRRCPSDAVESVGEGGWARLVCAPHASRIRRALAAIGRVS